MICLTLITLKNSLAAGLQRISDSLFLNDDKALESLPEPYIPSANTSDPVIAGEASNATMAGDKKETIREKATKQLHGSDSNPSMLGDPISLKAESSGTNPTPDEAGAVRSSSSGSTTQGGPEARTEKHDKHGGVHDGRGKETLREKAAKKLKGPDANPSQLGDPVSLKNETSDHIPRPSEAGARPRDSKL
ncbi:uncharacterized protein PG998_007942 [Apiospora kogelbergensis]|uniref:uncharacterized protein n=1 Tax=Apiospora kogelbergensis TaxID=1337665 RepID=UPI00312F5A27